MDGMTMRVREVEGKFLRRAWWVFPVAGVVLAMLTGGGFWAWVKGDVPCLDWRQAFTLRAAMLAGAGVVAAGMWRGLLLRTWRGWALLLAAMAGFAGIECVLRIPAVQTPFWLAMRARGYLPEVGYVRLEEAAGRPGEGAGVVLTGSSQMVFGVDEHLLRKLIVPTPVVRRAISGMWSQSMLAMWGWFPFRSGDVCVQVRSVFDYLGKPEFDANWFRPVASMEGVGMVLRATGWRLVSRHIGGVLDYLLAASLEGWRMRDGTRVLLKQMFKDSVAGKTKGLGKKRPSWEKMAWNECQWRALEEGARRLKAEGIDFWVFEGDVHPSLHDGAWDERRREWTERMARGEREGLWRLIGLEEQKAGLVADDWADGTHLTASGREKLTRAMGRVLQER